MKNKKASAAVVDKKAEQVQNLDELVKILNEDELRHVGGARPKGSGPWCATITKI